jgi:purine nucleosidase
MKILLDTDIGSDIDDAAALAYLLAHPQAELLGITTVSGEVQQRAMLVSALCRAAGKDIPIYPGRSEPLLVPQRQEDVQQAAALIAGRMKPASLRDRPSHFDRHHPRPSRRNHAAGNRAAHQPSCPAGSRPSDSCLLKDLVMMCGIFTNRLAGEGPLEWNALLDPHATAITYHHPFPVHRSIGLDVTVQVKMTAEEVRRRFHAPLLRPVLDFAEVWFQQVDILTFHDPLAAVTLFDEASVVSSAAGWR